MRRFVALFVVALLVAVPAVQAKTLLDNKKKPTAGLTESVKTENNAVIVTLTGPTANAVIDALKKKYPGATIEKINDKQIRIRGQAPAKIIAQLQKIDVGDPQATQVAMDSDPFEDIGDGPGLQVPDGSASIRARRRADVGSAQAGGAVAVAQAAPAGTMNPAGNLAANAVVIKVTKVERQQFPQATVTGTVESAPSDARYATAKAGSEISLVPSFNGNVLRGEANQGNIAVNYLLDGDKLLCEIVGFAGGKYICGTLRRVK